MNYENNNYNKQPLSHYLKKFLIGFLLVIILVFALMAVIPTKSGIKDSIKEAVTEGLNPFYDRIFADNLETMKEVAIAYFTTERLPKKEGDTKKLTLREMLEMKLLLEIKDKDGNSCDIDASYVELTKQEKEYKMKVNLKCGSEEDYIIVYLGCYSYCLNDICEKKEQTKKPATKTPVKTTNKVVTKHYCAVVNGKYYDNKGKVVSKTAYKKACTPEPTKHYCAIVNGKYYDNKGKVVTKAAYEKACKKEEPKHYCAVVNGKYYDDKGKVVTKAAYEKACKKEEKHYCAIVDGKYYDDKGNVVTKTAYEKACVKEEEPIYKYLYKKEVTTHYDKQYSEWGEWSDDKEYAPNNNTINWGKHELVWYEKNGSKVIKTTKLVSDANKPVYQDKKVYIGTYSRWVCSSYDYYIESSTNTLYQTGEWVYKGIVTTKTIPADTSSVKYEYVGFDYNNCGDICDISPSYKFKKYVRTTKTVTSSKEELSAVCNVTKKDVNVYATVSEFITYGKKKVTETKTVYYYHVKNRTLLKDAYTDTKVYTAWSYSKEDETLINQGYKYTGTYEKVN